MVSEWQLLVRILGTLVLGGVVGFEREQEQKPAGLRTVMLVTLGLTVFVDLITAVAVGIILASFVSSRWLAAGPRLLILDEPTRGVDVGAKAEIYRLIDRLARDGMAIMLISSEMPELLALSDRIVVMQDGRLSPVIEKKDATEEMIVSHALGKGMAA